MLSRKEKIVKKYMASFLTDLVKPYVEKLINGAIRESSYICCFTCIANDFEEEKARLEIESTTVKQRVYDAIRRGEDVQANALFWEKEADKLIQEDTKTKQKCLFGFCPHIIWRYKRGKELTNKKEQMKRLIETGKQLSIELPARLPDVERYSSQHYIPFKSRESKYKELLDAMKDDNNFITGLQGMGGTGKTTLAREVGKELKQSKQFTHVIDTTMSLSPNIRKIQDDIAGPLGLKFGDCSESDRPKKLWKRLTNGEKILLILDDVWGDIDFNEIGIPYSDNHKGCRILVTTRNLLVCNRLRCSKIVQLELLSDEEAWTMFQRHAGLKEMSPTSFLDKGRKIANECKGLPIAIAVIASSLKGIRHPEEWDRALKSLQTPMHGADDELVKIYKRLKVSYDNMKNENAKRLLLLCSVFREDEEIPTERLTRLGIGGGLFGEDYVSYEDARIQVVISKNKLLDSCLLLEADQSGVKMHDLVRDAAQWIANKEIQTVKLSDKKQKAMVEREANIKYLLCEGNLKDLFSFKLDGSKLEILIVTVLKDEDCHNLKIEVLNSFFENIKGLRVFHLINDDYHPRLALSLLRSVQLMKNIRSLLFTEVDLGDISIFGNLQSLETLDLNYCKIDELPYEITKLEKFRLLNLEYCIIARNDPFEVIKGCSSLEELYFIYSFNTFCREITFPQLKRFFIDSSYWRSKNDLSSRYVSLVARNLDVFLSETTLKYCMQEAEVLGLRRMEGGWRNMMPEIVPMDHGMNDLVKLSLSSISQLQCLIDTKHTESLVSKVFSKLVVLELEGMDNLEELFKGPLSFDSLNSLENLSIEDCKHLKILFECNINLCNLKSLSLVRCPMLISIFQLSTACSLMLLERLEIYDCEGLEYIIDERKWQESRSKIVDDNDNKSHGSMFQKLKVLSIKKCPRIELILPFHSPHDLPALESITIGSCNKLKYIFGKYVKLGSLINMKLDGLPNMIDIFPECYGVHERSSSISGYASKPQTQSGPIKRNIFSWTNVYCCGKKYGHKLRSNTSTEISLVSQDQQQDNLMESNSYPLNIRERAQCLSRQSHMLCNVKEITLTNVSKMKSLFNLSTAPRMLLETLNIWNCNEWRHIITIDTGDHHDNTDGNNWGTVFPKLRKLVVYNCAQLEYIIGHYNDGHQNNTKIHLHLPALEDLYLENLPSLVANYPKQYHTTFPQLKKLVVEECPQFIGDFLTHHSVTRSVDDTIIKESSGNMDNFLALETLMVNNNSKVEDVFCLNEINEQQLSLALKEIDLNVLPMMTFLFVGPKNSFFLQNLTHLKIMRCEKLKIVFSTSVIRCLPQLYYMRIEECNELKHIIEDDLENTTKICFPKLQILVVVKCNKLKYVFPISICKDLPELYDLRVEECNELKHIIEDDLENTTKTCFPKLRILGVVKCNKLKYVFSISICKDLPALYHMRIEECNELRHIIEDDMENKNSSNFMSTTKTCFPKLTLLVVEKCNKLKYVFPISISKELPKLNVLIIREADEFEEIFGSEGDDHKVEIPNLKFVVFENLPSLCHDQGIQFQAVKHRFILNCQKLSLASAIITTDLDNDLSGLYSDYGNIYVSIYAWQFVHYLRDLFRQLQTAKGFAAGFEVKASSEHELTSPNKTKQTPDTEHELVENVSDLEIPTNSKELMNQQSMEQQRLLGEADTPVKPSQECGDCQIAIPSPPIAITNPLTTQDVDININDDQVSVNDDSVIKVTSIVEEQLSKDVEFKVPESKPSPIIPSPQEFQTPSMRSKGDPSQNVEDLSSSLLVKSELEELVSKNHLDCENLSLLTAFLVRNPSVRLKDIALSNRYKGCAYNLLAELLKFLETHSVLEVLGPCHSKFVELLQDARSFGLDKDWLDGVERHEDALQKLLDSKQQVTKDVEVLRLKIGILSQHVEDLKQQLTSSEAVLETIIQQEAVLSAPFGY
ncbi:putative P-loop containing nucleoside triphosphate hydrolase, leucine-rich repeat domain, L [Medicago truncatula]|uniref:Putative P-loop containing nucleoside triphosphate hydrolase, leucine-rich repeat domain, L n=1 Tax=Medicago truncatula TaxID=3880 RepID=A0A396IYF7_MEDTR|nr:putative P-loop containing nucleoside triphosphate hydrolase, leucine-rich repeat domain, L [Medicago truncatula]